MKHGVWIVGRNLHLGPREAWSEGGGLEEYPLEHWDRYAVVAPDRAAARKKAMAERRRHAHLPDEQRQLLMALLARAGGAAACDGRRFEIDAKDAKTAERLAAKGLLDSVDGVDGVNVQLSVAAFNFSRDL